jgi:hypothetical protein
MEPTVRNISDPLRARRYRADRVFSAALEAIRDDLQKAYEIAPTTCEKFLKAAWLNEGRLAPPEDANTDKLVRDAMSRYLVFIERFKVIFTPPFFAESDLLEKDDLRKEPKLPKSSSPSKRELKLNAECMSVGPAQMALVAERGKIVPASRPIKGQEEDVREAVSRSYGLPDQVREKLRKSGGKRPLVRVIVPKRPEAEESILEDEEVSSRNAKRGRPRKDAGTLKRAMKSLERRNEVPVVVEPRIVELEIHNESKADIGQLLELAYDPIGITYVIVLSKGIEYLVAIVGEALPKMDWARQGKVVTAINDIYRKMKRSGRPSQSLRRTGYLDPSSPLTAGLLAGVLKSNNPTFPNATALDRNAAEKRLRRLQNRTRMVQMLLTRQEHLNEEW